MFLFQIIDADISIEKLTEVLLSNIITIVNRVKNLPLLNLW